MKHYITIADVRKAMPDGAEALYVAGLWYPIHVVLDGKTIVALNPRHDDSLRGLRVLPSLNGGQRTLLFPDKESFYSLHDPLLP